MPSTKWIVSASHTPWWDLQPRTDPFEDSYHAKGMTVPGLWRIPTGQICGEDAHLSLWKQATGAIGRNGP